ncbi:hypothetical protein [Nocardia jiangxiensis]|uniref:hypothetical protein n=1 Tax=Nocardia jiangxiensis TaxID=282685 RepID=UPI00030E57CE|nr:hypothetical protein [Nocardia jiangxiensis]
MKVNRFAAHALCVTAALGVTTGVVHAEPPAGGGGVYYTATNSQSSTVIRTDAGSMVLDNGVFKIKADDGAVLAGADLSFRVDDFVFPIAAVIHDRVATLTPLFDLAHATYRPVALPFENTAPWKSDYDREQAAWARLASTISMGATIGTLVGGLSGGAIGCLLGGVTLGAVTGALTAMFGALGGAAVGCLAGIAAVGFLGTVAGQILVTAPVAILAAVQYFTTINQPSLSTK